MIKNYFIVAWRNITRRLFYSSLNIVGLATGILFTLLIGAYVWNELQVNKVLRNNKNQYFLTSEWKDPNMGIPITAPGPLAKRLKEDYPGLVANYYRGDWITQIVSNGEKHLREGIDIGDSSLLSMYGFQLLHGDARTAMNNPYSVVLTADKALKYFGKTDVVGKTISIQSFSKNVHDFVITGVLKEIPENSVTDFNIENHHRFFIPASTFSYFPRPNRADWNSTIPSYIELKEGVSPKDVEKPIRQLLLQNAPDYMKDNLTIHMVALADYYLLKDKGLVKKMLYALSFAGLFILLMAIVNFINISISSSAARIREIGVRKVLGGLRKQIIMQFLTESIMIVLLATVLSLAAYPVARPLFGDIVGKEIPGLSSFPLYFIFIPALLVLLVGVVAGLYPAFVLSSLKSVDSIKGKLKGIKENVTLRKSLAGFQFCIAGIVLIAACIVTQQVNYFFSQSLGYNKEYVVSSQVPRDWTPEGVHKMQMVRNEFASMPQVSQVSLSYEIPNGMNGDRVPLYRQGSDPKQAASIQIMFTDDYYLDTYQIPVTAGTFFNKAGEGDSNKIVINETAAKALGWLNPGDAVDKQVKIPGDSIILNIKGVTSNFHFNSMHQAVPPIVFIPVEYGNYRYLSFKIKPGNTVNTIAAIEKKWAALLPGSSFEYVFMDDTLKKLYKAEIQLRKASYTATILSLLIVLLGVLGLVSLSIQKRTKEIGIRKVLGASISSITALFVKEFLTVIIIAGVIACPVALFIMNGWLNNYASRISLTAQPFIISVAGLLFVTALLIALQTVSTAKANPIKSLRSE